MQADSYTLVLIRIHTGVTHQVRATLAHLGTPVANDPIYSKKAMAHKVSGKKDEQYQALLKLAKTLEKTPRSSPDFKLLPEDGFFLHALRVALHHKGEDHEIFCPAPIWFGL